MNTEILNSILQGWTNFIFKSEKIEELAKVRAELCSGCLHANPEYPFKRFIPEEKRIEVIKGLACNLCGCPLSAKLRSPLETCPDIPSKW